jgi:hypothetical protein
MIPASLLSYAAYLLLLQPLLLRHRQHPSACRKVCCLHQSQILHHLLWQAGCLSAAVADLTAAAAAVGWHRNQTPTLLPHQVPLLLLRLLLLLLLHLLVTFVVTMRCIFRQCREVTPAEI